MKKLFIFAVILFSVSLRTDAQKPVYILAEPAGWNKEIMTFPIDFAPEVNYQGLEDIRFAPGWGNDKNDQFWCYTFVWWLDNSPVFDENKLATDMEEYFTGLANSVLKSKNKTVENLPKTLATFKKDKSDNKNVKVYKGKINMYDAFVTFKPITLNIKTYILVCKDKNKTAVFFEMSPQNFKHEIWKELDKIYRDFNCK